MTAFYVGQRVKRIAWDHERANNPAYIGATGTVTSTHEAPEWTRVRWDDPACSSRVSGRQEWDAFSFSIAPLTDPGADAFLESVKRWGPLHEEPVVTKEQIRERAFRRVGYPSAPKIRDEFV